MKRETIAWTIVGFLLVLLFYNGKLSAESRTHLQEVSRQSIPRNLVETANRTTLKRPSRTIFYNRLPKCGSRSFLKIVRSLAKRNNFTFAASDDYSHMRPPHEEMVKEMRKIINLEQPAFYNRHILFLDFESFGYKKPIYINLIRDPVERFASNYNYLKYGDITRAGGQIRTNPNPRYALDINECVKKNTGPCRTDFLYFTGMYFCGFNAVCRTPSLTSANLAKKHIDEEYSFIGMTEEFENSLRLIEKILPEYFAGALDVWQHEREDRNKTATYRYDELTEESKKILRLRDMAFEYEVYNHAKRKYENLKKQYGIL